jgi:proteasome assembly chaperone (PAC2) family protein
MHGMSGTLTITPPNPPLRDPIVVVAFRGWNDAAGAASATISTIAEQMGSESIGSVDPEEFYDFQVTRPIIDLTGPEHTLSWPEVEISAVRVPDGPHDLVLVVGGEPSMRWPTFCRLLLDGVEALGVHRFVTLGALLADVPHTRDVMLTVMSTEEGLIDGMDTRPPGYRGPTGIVGVLHLLAAERGLQAVSLWAPTSHYAAGVVNHKAELALLDGVSRITGARFDTAEVRENAREFEEQVDQVVAADPRLQQLVEQLEQAADEDRIEDADLPSGDELVAELERFLRERQDPPPPQGV